MSVYLPPEFLKQLRFAHCWKCCVSNPPGESARKRKTHSGLHCTKSPFSVIQALNKGPVPTGTWVTWWVLHQMRITFSTRENDFSYRLTHLTKCCLILHFAECQAQVFFNVLVFFLHCKPLWVSIDRKESKIPCSGQLSPFPRGYTPGSEIQWHQNMTKRTYTLISKKLVCLY